MNFNKKFFLLLREFGFKKKFYYLENGEYNARYFFPKKSFYLKNWSDGEYQIYFNVYSEELHLRKLSIFGNNHLLTTGSYERLFSFLLNEYVRMGFVRPWNRVEFKLEDREKLRLPDFEF